MLGFRSQQIVMKRENRGSTLDLSQINVNKDVKGSVLGWNHTKPTTGMVSFGFGCSPHSEPNILVPKRVIKMGPVSGSKAISS